MDPTTATAVAITGLTTALIGTLTVPLLQNYFTAKREAASRMDERRHAAYVDAITYAQVVETRLNQLTEDPLYRTSRQLPPTPDQVLIRAKLELVAPVDVARAFDSLVSAWDILGWNLNEAGPTGAYGEFQVDGKDEDAVRVSAALRDLKGAVRPKALGTTGIEQA